LKAESTFVRNGSEDYPENSRFYCDYYIFAAGTIQMFIGRKTSKMFLFFGWGNFHENLLEILFEKIKKILTKK
jgi:hypothetical protein